MPQPTITSIDAKLEYIVEIMVRMAEYEEKSIKEFRSDLDQINQSSRSFNLKMDRIVEENRESSRLFTLKMDQMVEENKESFRLFNLKMDRLSEQIIIVNETSKRQEHHIDRLVGIVKNGRS